MNTTNAPSSVPGSLSQEDRNWGMIGHLSALAAFIAPFLGGVLGPLIVYLVKRDQSAFAAESAKEALNFNITVAIGYCVCGLLAIVFIGIPLMIALWLAWLVLTIVAGVRASEGISYRYPATLRFVK
jgi:uncharacterized Tic20 family protein